MGAGSARNFAEEAMFVEHFSSTFYSMMTRFKKKYQLLSEEQA